MKHIPLVLTLEALRLARKEATDAKDYVKHQRAEFEESIQADVDAAVKATARVAELEMEVRKLTASIYNTTKEKKPVDGVEVKVGKLYEYDRGAVLEWAETESPSLIVKSLNEEAFLAMFKAFKTPPPKFPVVLVGDEPKVTITKEIEEVDSAAVIAEAVLEHGSLVLPQELATKHGLTPQIHYLNEPLTPLTISAFRFALDNPLPTPDDDDDDLPF